MFLFSRPAGRLKRTPVIYNIICKLPVPNTTRLVNYIYIWLGLVDSNHRIKSGVLGGTRTSNLLAEGRKSDRYTTRPHAGGVEKAKVSKQTPLGVDDYKRYQRSSQVVLGLKNDRAELAKVLG